VRISIHRVPAISRFWRQQLLDALKGSLRGKTAIRFRCNVCGRDGKALSERFGREQVSCRCGSTVRFRSLIHVLSLELFGESKAIADFPIRPDLVGLDMSGAANYALPLAQRIGYVNTFLHKAPFLDITSPGKEWLSRCDFLISSDVFEHVAPPVSRAFRNAIRLLKPGGVLVLTVPYRPEGQTLEHFPDLHDFRIEKRNGRHTLTNVTSDGRHQVFENLVFHGGEGETLEMRVFSLRGLIDELENAGFEQIRVHDDAVPEFGIAWPQPWSLPLSARRPLSTSDPLP
jgi:SAM-dependent methyltransferase